MCACMCVPHMEAALLLSFTTSPSCSNTQSAAYCALLPSMAPSAPPTFPHLCSCPFSNLTLSSLHIPSYLSLFVSILCSISCWTLLLLPTAHWATTKMFWAFSSPPNLMIWSFVSDFIHHHAGLCLRPGDRFLESSWKIAVGKQINEIHFNYSFLTATILLSKSLWGNDISVMMLGVKTEADMVIPKPAGNPLNDLLVYRPKVLTLKVSKLSSQSAAEM